MASQNEFKSTWITEPGLEELGRPFSTLRLGPIIIDDTEVMISLHYKSISHLIDVIQKGVLALPDHKDKVWLTGSLPVIPTENPKTDGPDQ